MKYAMLVLNMLAAMSLPKLVNVAAIVFGLLGNQFGAPLGFAPILLAAVGAFNLVYPKFSSTSSN